MSIHRTVLVIAGSDLCAKDYGHQLQDNAEEAYEIIPGHYGDISIHILVQSQPDAILLDLSSSSSEGLSFLQQWKEWQAQWGDRLPPVIVIGDDDTTTAVHAFKQGAVDYLMRDRTTPKDLRLAVREAIAPAPACNQCPSQSRELAEAMPPMGWSADATELPSIAPRTGLPIEQFLYAIHPDDRQRVTVDIEQAIATGKQYATEFRIRNAAGEERWVIAWGKVEYDANGTAIAFPGALTDISDRKQAQQDLWESEARFRTLADNISQFAWMTDETGWIFWYNQRWFDYTGTTLEEMQGWGWQQVHHPDHVDRVVSRFRQSLETGETWEDTFPLRGRDGQYRWFLSRAIPVRDAQGRVKRWFGTNTDITDRKQAEEALRQSEERYRCLAELIPQLVWTATPDGELQDVNQRWTEFTGLTLEQAKTTGWEQVVHPQDLPVLVQRWTEAVQQRMVYQAEGRMRQANGLYRWHLHQAIPQLDEQGQLVKWFGTATDIHVQKQLEIERDHLLNLERTAREYAERANRIKDEFLAVLSHELRSPLNPILGWTKLLQTGKLSATQTVEALNTIERNAKLQTQLIDDLLDIARILRGKLSLDLKPVPLIDVIEAAMDTVKTAAAAKSITLQSTLLNIGQVSGDATRLQQIVWNLLSNAIKFTPVGGRVEVSLEKVEEPASTDSAKAYAQITVTDTGKGIRRDFLPYIFESFRQEDASTTRKYGGLGLGLSIVRQLVEAHGGTALVDSPGEGLGATFTIRLPLLEAIAEIPQPHPKKSYPSVLTGIRILAVDDDEDSRELLDVLLTQYGAEVLTVTSAAELLAHLASFQPDVLISDIGMPDKDGYALLQEIRLLPDEAGGQVPAIALTAYARDDDYRRAIASGFQRHVTKPLDPEKLVQAIVSLLVQGGD